MEYIKNSMELQKTFPNSIILSLSLSPSLMIKASSARSWEGESSHFLEERIRNSIIHHFSIILALIVFSKEGISKKKIMYIFVLYVFMEEEGIKVVETFWTRHTHYLPILFNSDFSVSKNLSKKHFRILFSLLSDSLHSKFPNGKVSFPGRAGHQQHQNKKEMLQNL